ncbi:MAG TPA: ATP-dependent DNA helicase RecG [Patescibacteria group bacterium]|nr:ATP-dependent DNA helicase RecG [Patescibacteria group bacterium]
MKLNDPVSKLVKVGPVYVNRLKSVGINKIDDLLKHIPFRYIDYSKITKIGHVHPGDQITITGEIKFIKNQYTKSGKKMQLSEVEDDTGKLKVIWFNQPYLIMTIKKGMRFSFSGEVGYFGSILSMVSPEYEMVSGDSINTGRIVPVYPQTKGLSSKWLRGRIHFLLENNSFYDEYISGEDRSKYHLWEINKTIKKIHFPDNIAEAQTARKRFAFDEMLFLHLKSLYRKRYWEKNATLFKLKIDDEKIDQFIKNLPFKLTISQINACEEILNDMKKNVPMNRLLEGDVGSGKTVVAATAAFTAFLNGYQSVIMAPTQILASQHFETITKLFEPYKIRAKLITSAGEKGDLGSSDIYIGTHALIHRVIDSQNVALVVIDEQHRFGVEQRNHLVRKIGLQSKSPHILTMTATPIPRTIALTIYGDLTLSILHELPKGRVPISTWIVPSRKRENAYSWIGKELKRQKTQAYIVCPLIEESEIDTMSQIKAATVEFENIKNVFKSFKVGLLHGRLKLNEKEKVINNFKQGFTDILVTTPVVEVGIDVANANIMIIEAAERFGLAQLHQLRGRIGRGTKKSYCMLFSNSNSEKVKNRLLALQKSLSGFELAELDLKLRGPGQIYGTLQHGFDELKIASWSDFELIEKTRIFAEEIVKYPKRYNKILKKFKPKDYVLN